MMQCIAEVTHYVDGFLRSDFIPAIDGDVVKSDRRISSILKNELQKTAASIRGDARLQFRTDDVVVDVVDPYLFSFAWDRSKTLRGGELTLSNCISRCGDGETVKMPTEEDCAQKDRAKYPNDMAWSRRFQYLPFDVKFDNRGEGRSRSVAPPPKSKSTLTEVTFLMPELLATSITYTQQHIKISTASWRDSSTQRSPCSTKLSESSKLPATRTSAFTSPCWDASL